MIFFMVMPSLIGGFGKNKKQLQNYATLESLEKEGMESLDKYSLEFLRSRLGNYLAGLIESDGSIAVHDKNTRSKRYTPKILIVFNLNDIPLAEKLIFICHVGKLYIKKKQGCAIWHIQNINEVIKMIKIINGYMRTPKIEALHRAISWYNNYLGTNIEQLGLDLSPINSNAWLAGFSDGDSNFSITLTDRKKKGKITTKRVQAFFRIELRQNYHRGTTEELGGISYFRILSEISRYLGVNLYSRSRQQGEKIFYSYMVIAHSMPSQLLVIEYFDRYPLYSSKFLAYKDWKLVIEQIRSQGKPLTEDNISDIKKIKAQFNNNRTIFDFSHLDSIVP